MTHLITFLKSRTGKYRTVRITGSDIHGKTVTESTVVVIYPKFVNWLARMFSPPIKVVTKIEFSKPDGRA